jgi:predicted PurR-regulated permease PerM
MFFVFRPFFTALFLAATFSIVLFPLYKKILRIVKGREVIGSLLTILIGLVFVIIPITFLGQEAFEQARGLYVKLSTNDVSELAYLTKAIEGPVQKFIPEFTFSIDQYIEYALGLVTNNFKDVLFGTLAVIGDVFLIILSMFFFLKDGERMLARLVTLSPLHDSYDQELLVKTTATIGTVVKGTVLIALIQGVFAGLGLFIFGIPNAALWGAVAALCAFVPGLGTALVIVPSVIYLFIVGNIAFAAGLSGWGMILVGMIDNILGPYLYKKGTRLNSLVVLLSVIGGISFFGPEGLLLGPVIASLFISLVHIYEKMVIGNVE